MTLGNAALRITGRCRKGAVPLPSPMSLSTSTATFGFGLAFLALLVKRVLELRRLLRTVPAGIQGDVLLFDPTTRLPMPNIKWISRSQSWNLSTKHSRSSRFAARRYAH